MTDGFTDAAGTLHAATPSARIVSLVPSITELLFDLGLADQLVGRTSYCVHPAGMVDDVASVGGTKTVKLERISALGATHAVVNIDENPKEIAVALAELGIQVIVTHPIEVSDNKNLFRLLGGIFGPKEEAERLCESFDEAFGRLTDQARHWPPRNVLYLVWRKPWMTVSPDTYISRILALANLRTIGGDGEARYPEIDLTDSLVNRAELVLFSTEPFPFKERHLTEFRERFPGDATKAHLIDAEMVSWYGSRAIAGLAYLGEFAGSLAP